MSELELGDARRVARQRRAQTRQRVLITGIGGNLGRALARRLHRSCEVFGLDRRPVRHMPKDITIEMVDIRRRRAEDVFRRERLDAVVHLNILHDPRADEQLHHDFNLNGTQKIAALCAEHHVSKLIVLSSANVYGPDPSNDQLLKEDSPLMASQSSGQIRDLVSLDMLCTTFFWRYPEIETVLLRPAHIVGRVDNAPSRYLRMSRPPMLLGFDPMIQLIHVEDVVRALELSLVPGLRGVFNVAGPAPTPLSYVIKRRGGQPRVIPEPMVGPMLKMLWALKLGDWRGPELDHLKYVCMVDDAQARRALRYEPAHDLDSILASLEGKIRFDGRSA